MPKSKKNKLVSLTQVKPKPRAHKQFIVNKAHSFLKTFKYTYVLRFENMSTNNFKSLRESLNDSKFLMGKNRVLQIAFGTTEQDSFLPNSYQISENLKGYCTLFFTDKKANECKQIFENFVEAQFATGGSIATETILLPKGFQQLKSFSHSMEPYLRTLGLPTRLVNSKIELTSDYLLAEEDKPLNVEKCKILKLLGIRMGRLKFQIQGIYDKKNYKKINL